MRNMIMYFIASCYLIFLVNDSCISLLDLYDCLLIAMFAEKQYGWVILLLLIVEFIAAVLVYRFRSEIKDEAVKGLKIGIEKWSGRSYEPLDDIQKQLKCCGAENANDWHLNPKFNVTLEYPNSCCKDLPHPESCPKPEYTEPCVPKIVEEFKSVALQVGGVGIAVAVIQLLAVISSCALARAFKREYEVV